MRFVCDLSKNCSRDGKAILRFRDARRCPGTRRLKRV